MERFEKTRIQDGTDPGSAYVLCWLIRNVETECLTLSAAVKLAGNAENVGKLGAAMFGFSGVTAIGTGFSSFAMAGGLIAPLFPLALLGVAGTALAANAVFQISSREKELQFLRSREGQQTIAWLSNMLDSGADPDSLALACSGFMDEMLRHGDFSDAQKLLSAKEVNRITAKLRSDTARGFGDYEDDHEDDYEGDYEDDHEDSYEDDYDDRGYADNRHTVVKPSLVSSGVPARPVLVSPSTAQIAASQATTAIGLSVPELLFEEFNSARFLCGPSGVGKTTIGSAYAEFCQERGIEVILLNLQCGEVSPLTEIADESIVANFSHSSSVSSSQSKPILKSARSLLAEFVRRRDSLLIIDEMPALLHDDIGLLEELQECISAQRSSGTKRNTGILMIGTPIEMKRNPAIGQAVLPVVSVGRVPVGSRVVELDRVDNDAATKMTGSKSNPDEGRSIWVRGRWVPIPTETPKEYSPVDSFTVSAPAISAPVASQPAISTPVASVPAISAPVDSTPTIPAPVARKSVAKLINF